MRTEASRPESTGPLYVAAFDAFRGFAVMTIVVVHLMYRSEWVPGVETLRSLFVTGFFAVDVFFMISGFVMFLPVAVRGSLGDVRAFALRRFARIAPAFYVAILVTVVLLPVIVPNPGDPGLPPHDPLSIVFHLLFLHNEVAIGYDAYYPGFGVNPAVWTLSVEILFYLALPLIAVPFRRHPLVGLAVGALVTVAWRLLLDPAPDYTQNALAPSDLHQLWKQFPLFTFDFAAGMAAAIVYVDVVRGERFASLKRNATAVAGTSLLALLAILVVTGATLTGAEDHIVIAGAAFMEPLAVSLVFPLLAGVFMVSASLMPERLQWPFTNRASRKLGDIAYGVYLYHLVIIGFAFATLGFPTNGTIGDFLAYAAFTVPLSLAFGWLSLAFVERPTRAWARRLGRRLARRSEPGPRAERAPASS